jgi:hypothetical protein
MKKVKKLPKSQKKPIPDDIVEHIIRRIESSVRLAV